MENVNKPYKKSVLGGTFDRFHNAHRSLIKTAAFMADTIFIGIVSESLGKILFKSKKFADIIQSYNDRKSNVMSFVKTLDVNFEIGPLNDPYGPAPTDPIADLIVVSHETINSAHKINQLRFKNGLKKLDIIAIPWEYDDNGNILSSTNLREKELHH